MEAWEVSLIVSGSIVSLIFFITILMIVIRKKKGANKHEEFNDLLEALGGIENIYNVTYSGSRINLNFNNKKIIDKEKIKQNGVQTIVISNDKITLVTGKQAEKIYNYFNELLNQKG